MKKSKILFILFWFLSLFLFSQQLFINEFMADNQAFGEDPDEPGAYDDWFELFNNDVNNDVLLDGMYLTNDLNNLTMWEIPANNIISAGGFLVFVADNQEYQGNNHTNFTLQEENGEIALVDRNGITIVDSYSYGIQSPDISEGRVPDGSPDWQFLMNPSPGRSNTDEGPYFDQIYSASSSDGIHWTVIDELIFDHASVPGAVFYNNKIYLYFVNAAEYPENEKLSVGISEDSGFTFTVHDVQITGNYSPNPVDPNPIIDNGEIRLTYLGNFLEGESFDIVTATSSDGINFIEDGVIFSGFVFDPDLFYDANNEEWVLLLSTENLIKATAPTPTSIFTLDQKFIWEHGNISSTHLFGTNYYTYYYGFQGVSVAEYLNGELSQLANGILNFPGLNADPTVVILGENNYKMFFKTEAGNNPLPVELSTFTAFYNNVPNLSWTTQSETNNIGWNIYRSENENFSNSLQINPHLIPGAGTSSEPVEYTFIDEYDFTVYNNYWYWLENIDQSGQTNSFGPVMLCIPENEENPEAPESEDFKICNYPNPFNSSTTIYFDLNAENIEDTEIIIYNLKGQKIKTLECINHANAKSTQSHYSITWNSTDKNNVPVSSGVYFYKLKSGTISFMKKMIIMR